VIYADRAVHAVTLILLVLLASCSKSDPAPPPAPVTPSQASPPEAPAAQPTATFTVVKPLRDPEAAKRLVAGGAVVLDVRTADEYADGHLPNAVNIPVQDLGGRLAEVEKLVAKDKSRPIVVYCAAGSRAASAKTALESAGFTQVVNGGGYEDLR
jgi:phage shock protein E